MTTGARRRGPSPGPRGHVEVTRFVLDLGSTTTPLVVRRNPGARRISIRVAPAGEAVIVVVPADRSREDALAVARANTPWIRERLAALPGRVSFVDGVLLPVYGRPLRIRHDPDRRAGAVVDGDELRVGGAGEPASRVSAWLRREARRVFELRVADVAGKFGRPVAGVTVRDTRSRWGSCSAAGKLSFSWRLLLAPPDVLDYVVAHEVAHLRHRGHGPAFWGAVHQLSGDPAPAREWLRRHGRELFRYG